MEFFDKLGKKASEAYKITADKTGKIAKETKLKLKMSELKNQTKELYEEIGRTIYEKHVEKQDITNNDVEELCTKIDVISDELDSLLQECLELENKKQCTNCFAKINKNDKFCKECGAEQVEEIIEEPVEVIENSNEANTESDDESNDSKSNDTKSNEEKEIQKDSDEKSKDNLQNTVAIESDIEIDNIEEDD